MIKLTSTFKSSIHIILLLVLLTSCQKDSINKKNIECGIYAPVCGVDGKTYENQCAIEKVKIKLAYQGECTVSDKCYPDPVCGKLIGCDENGPVCGTDGQSYVNKDAAVAKGVSVAYNRACFAESQIRNCELICLGPPSDNQSICADDGFKYPSECFAATHGRKKVLVSKCKDGNFSCDDIEHNICFDGSTCKKTGLPCPAHEN